MTPSELEHDLIDFIEGDLPPERLPSVKHALASNPALARTVQGILDDRRRLSELARATELAARADRQGALDMIRQALARAERDALLEPRTQPAVRAHDRPPRRRWHLLAAAAVLLLASIASVLITRAALNAQRARELAAARKVERAGQAVILTPESPSSTPAPSEPATIGTLPSWISDVNDPIADAAMQSWQTELAQPRHDDPPIDELALAHAARARLDNGGAPSLAIDEAAAVALIARLRLVIRADSKDLAARRPDNHPTRAFAARFLPPPDETKTQAAPDSEGPVLELTVPIDPDRAALRDALESLRATLAGPDPTDAWYEIDPTPSNPSLLPALDLRSILWWANRPADWTRAVSIRIQTRTVPPDPPR